MNRYPWVLCCSVLSMLFGCQDSVESASPETLSTQQSQRVPSNQQSSVVVASTQSTTELWQRSCALCHVDGNAGAPRIGNQEEWGERLEKGPDVLLRNTFEGLNQMPPLGYCMACERSDFIALIDFMTEGLAQ